MRAKYAHRELVLSYIQHVLLLYPCAVVELLSFWVLRFAVAVFCVAVGYHSQCGDSAFLGSVSELKVADEIIFVGLDGVDFAVVFNKVGRQN